MKSIDTMTSEYIRLERECAEHMYPFDIFTDSVRARWSTMNDAGKRIHLSRSIRCYKAVLSAIDPNKCPVCGQDLIGNRAGEVAECVLAASCGCDPKILWLGAVVYGYIIDTCTVVDKELEEVPQ